MLDAIFLNRFLGKRQWVLLAFSTNNSRNDAELLYVIITYTLKITSLLCPTVFREPDGVYT